MATRAFQEKVVGLFDHYSKIAKFELIRVRETIMNTSWRIPLILSHVLVSFVLTVIFFASFSPDPHVLTHVNDRQHLPLSVSNDYFGGTLRQSAVSWMIKCTRTSYSWLLKPTPISHEKAIISLSSFPNFTKKLLDFCFKKYWIGKGTHCSTIYVSVLLRTRWPQL